MNAIQEQLFIAEEDKYYEVQVDLAQSLLHVRFKRHLEGNVLRKRLLKIKELINTYQLRYMLKDVSKIYYLKVADANWLAATFIPDLKKSSLERYARIEKAGSLLQLNSIRLQNKIRSESEGCSPLQFESFVEAESALHWLLDLG